MNLSDTLKRLPPSVLRGGAALLVAVVAVCGYLLWNTGAFLPHLPELAELAAHRDWTFLQFDSYFRKLAEDKGGMYAYNVLYYADMPPDIDLHLLGHTVGYVLYSQKGIDAIKLCTQDFRNACSHSVVISILRDFGEGALPRITDVCRDAPGGKGAYTMCFHGLGHGILAYTDYDLGKAVTMCRKTGTPQHNYREYAECVGGTIMELIDGVHDPSAQLKAQQKYFSASDPLAPCDTTVIPDATKSTCYAYLTPHLFEAAGADLENPTPDAFGKAFSFCGALPKDDAADRAACYGGFGKEFIALAQGRDIRDVGSMSEPQLAQMRAWCARAGNAKGESDCNMSGLASLFWGGENKPDAAFTFCEIAEGEARDECYTELTNQIGYYVGGTVQGSALCFRLPEPYLSQCRASAP